MKSSPAPIGLLFALLIIVFVAFFLTGQVFAQHYYRDVSPGELRNPFYELFNRPTLTTAKKFECERTWQGKPVHVEIRLKIPEKNLELPQEWNFLERASRQPVVGIVGLGIGYADGDSKVFQLPASYSTFSGYLTRKAPFLNGSKYQSLTIAAIPSSNAFRVDYWTSEFGDLNMKNRLIEFKQLSEFDKAQRFFTFQQRVPYVKEASGQADFFPVRLSAQDCSI